MGAWGEALQLRLLHLSGWWCLLLEGWLWGVSLLPKTS